MFTFDQNFGLKPFIRNVSIKRESGDSSLNPSKGGELKFPLFWRGLGED